MKTNNTPQNTLACIVAGVIGTIVFLRISQKFLTDFVPTTAFLGIAAIYLAGTIAYIFIWKRKAKQPGFDSERTLALWQGITRYFLALDLCMFGFEKIFHLQFVIPLGMLDNPFSSLTPDNMMWAFFGHFYSYTVIIAGLQMCGSLLLLFRRTRLLGTILLLPILLNILLIDYYYNPGISVDIYATLLTLATVYLLLLDYNRLVEFFLKTKSSLPEFNFKNSWVKNMLRFSVIYVPLLLMAMYKFPQYYPEIYGKYEVKTVTINGRMQDHPSCNDSTLTKVFIDNNDFVMEYDNYQDRNIGKYTYDPATQQISVVWHYPANLHDTLRAKIIDGMITGSKIVKGTMGKNAVLIEMDKANK